MKEPVWLTVPLVRVLHLQLIVEHGGETDIRDAGLLESAVERAPTAWSHGVRDLSLLAARYGHGLSSRHPFVDGNKRIAFTATDVFLRLNGFQLDAAEEEAYLTIMDLARGLLDEEGLAEWIRANWVPLT